MLRWLFDAGRFDWAGLRAATPGIEPALARQVIEGRLAEGVLLRAAPG